MKTGKKAGKKIVLSVSVFLLAGALVWKTGDNIAQENRIPKVEVTLEDTTLEEIHDGDKKVRYEAACVSVTDPEQGDLLTDYHVEIRGRGNSSWKMPKKSYQLHFGRETELLGMDPAEKWVLIANYADASLMRNKLMYDLAGEMMDYVPESRYVDLWVDGEYLGNYLLCEKVETGVGRVDLKDERGLLIEIDNIYYYEEARQFQGPASGSHFTLKDAVNEAYADEAFAEFEVFIGQLEHLLYAEEKDWNQISQMIDVESFVEYYYIEEMAENSDSCRTSLYMYWDGSDDRLHMGPVWDFDKAVGYSMRGKYGGNTQNDYVRNIQDYMGEGKDLTWYTELFKIPEFCEAAREIYEVKIHEVFGKAGELLEQYREQISASAENNFLRWDITEIPKTCDHEPYMYENWGEAVDGLKQWVEERIEYMETSLLTKEGSFGMMHSNEIRKCVDEE